MPDESPAQLIVAEPAAPYAARRPLVADCSVIAALLFDEAQRDEATRILARHDLYAPDLLDTEMVSVALKKAALMSAEEAGSALDELAQMPVTRCRINPAAQFAVAAEYGLTAYDAAYLQLALDLKAPLATFDQRLGTAARRALSA